MADLTFGVLNNLGTQSGNSQRDGFFQRGKKQKQ